MSANNLAKSTKEKDHNDNDLCKKHTSRCDKDYTRSICPSKLSKRELEDLYYSLMENNLELKRTINALSEKNRMLSTKVQRITTQTKTYMGKDCCAAGKAVINEQKAMLADMTKANEALADRVRRLNTQLCTAKQFLKQSPNARQCYKCYSTSTSVKNSSTTSLQNKSSNINLKSAAASAIQLDQEPPSTRTAETNTLENVEESDEKEDPDKVCNENRCRATMEQFKQKIGDLKEELAKTHTEYSTRMTQLESQVSQLQAAGARARCERERESTEIARRSLRQAEVDKAELETQLSMEKKKVAELEMRLKSAELSQQVAQTVEQHLNTACRREEKQLRQTSIERCSFCSNVLTDISPQPMQSTTPTKTPNQLTVPDDRVCKSDDSGYADHQQDTDIDDKNVNQTNQELMKKIEELQAQLNALKSISAEKDNTELETSPCPKTFDQYYIQSDEDQEIKDNEKVPPKHTQISISEPAVGPSKELITETSPKDMHISERRKSKLSDELDPMSEINTPVKDEYPCKEKERNDSDLGENNHYGENENTSDSDQAADTNMFITCKCHNENREDFVKKCECKKHSTIWTNRSVDIENGLNTCSSRDSDREEVTSISLQHVAGSINKKPDDNSEDKYNATHEDNESVNSATTTKRKRVSLVIFEDRTANRLSTEIGPKSPDSTEKDTAAETSKVKAHTCNFQQIPGPLPVNSEPIGKRKVSLSDRRTEYYGKTNIDGHTKDKAAVKKRHLGRDTKNHQDEKNNVGENVNTKDDVLMKNFEDKNVYNRKNKGLVIEVQYPEGYKKDHDNDLFIRNQEKLSEVGTPLKVRSNVITDYKGAREILKDRGYNTESFQMGNSAKINGITKINEFGLKDKPIGSSTPKADRAAPTSPHTYTIESGNSRPDSPANTDNEISVMTDLPSEKDDTYERLSPGEHRPTGASTETCSLRYGLSLSEGEVPLSNHEYRKTSKSLRRTDYEKELKTSYPGEQKSPTEKMEATLRVISQELARCRSLLLSQKPTEQKDAATGFDYREPLPLRKTVAKSRIDGTAAPTCLFVMHVQSVVFSDEAVLRSHDAHLMLSWQFADCKPTVIALDAGRVVHFDFSTQHELHMTKEVMDYLKKEDLSILISEIDSAKKTFASCTLPLRQVLLNINSRIDFSLPLKAGPYLTDYAPGTTNAGEDVGVLDVGCMLICEERPILATNHSISQCSETLKTQRNAGQFVEKNPNKVAETTQQKPEARTPSFQRQKFTVPSDDDSNPPNTITNLEARHQVGFEEPYGREKKISLSQYYEKDGDAQRNSTISLQPDTMIRSKSRFSKVPDDQCIEITILWLTLNENCDPMLPEGRKLYVAYTFLGRGGAELETPVSLPKPQHYADKCIFNFRKSFNLTEIDMRVLEHMVSCRSQNRSGHSSNDCIVFTVVSEPPEDPLGLDNCEDIGFAFLYLGDILAYCYGNSFTEALPVRGAHAPSHACGVLAVRVDGLDVLRACQQRTT